MEIFQKKVTGYVPNGYSGGALVGECYADIENALKEMGRDICQKTPEKMAERWGSMGENGANVARVELVLCISVTTTRSDPATD